MFHAALRTFLIGVLLLSTANAAERGITAYAVAQTPKRVALVVGNDRYATLPALNNAGKDARDIAASLESLGFDVILKTNAGLRDMGRALAEFEGKLGGAEAGLVFYAGHGIQAEGRNYLIPSDARIEIEEDLRFMAVDASEFLNVMARAGSLVNILVIDACRDNPLPRRSRSTARGLTAVAVPAGIKGTAILYSAGPGQTAADGPKGGNGVFTAALLAALKQPGRTVEQVFKETARRVAETTGGRQTPWNNSSLTGDFYFRPQAPGPSLPEGPDAAPADAEVVFWKSVQNSDNAARVEEFLKQFPKGRFSGLARIKLDELKASRLAALPAATSPASQPAGPSRDLIQEVQRLLNALDYGIGPVDGHAGPRTEGAVRAFQSTGGLPVTGAIDETLAAALRRAAAERRTASAPPVTEPARASDLPAASAPPRIPVAPSTAVPEPNRPGPDVKPGRVFRDCEGDRLASVGDSVAGMFCGPEMVAVPPGAFDMGDLADGGLSNRAPVHTVTIPRTFAVGRYEVTRAEFSAFVRDTGYETAGCRVWVGSTWVDQPGKNWRDPGYAQADDHPVTCVNWKDAQAFVGWLGRKTGKPYRLLSESEWEYVARAGTQRKRFWGNSEEGCAYANGPDLSAKARHPGWPTPNCRDGFVETAPVGHFENNPFGVHDILGNVWEWVEDCWNGSYAGAPTNGESWTAGDCGRRVLRGGSWHASRVAADSALRNNRDIDLRASNFGIRVARAL